MVGRGYSGICAACGERLPVTAARCPHCGALAGMRPWPRFPAFGAAADLPPIRITAPQAMRLERLAKAWLGQGDEAARFLMQEVRRATICRPEDLPADTAAIGSSLIFRHVGGGPAGIATLVYPGASPDEPAPAARTVPITTPLGIAMVGLGEGVPMPYRGQDGQPRWVVVERVLRQPEQRP